MVEESEDALFLSTGATEMVLILNEKQYPKSRKASLLAPSMRPFQGPALYAYNDSIFTPKDYVNICNLGSSLKRSAIGQYGLGFNSVYHWTDVPSFVSGSKVVFFDPHAKYVQGATPIEPGVRWDFVNSKVADEFEDQFSVYKDLVPGCDMKNYFEGRLHFQSYCNG
jgi:sacsin